MIISCKNCKKIFDIDSSLIPVNGRLVQCNNCNHKWFFKNEIIKTSLPLPETVKNEEVELPETVKKEEVELPETVKNEEVELPETVKPTTIELLDKEIKQNFTDKKFKSKANVKNNDLEPNEIGSNSNKKIYTILSITIIFIISSVATIIVLDTFKTPIAKFVPNIEFLLYNLYESVRDIMLFFKDLI